MPERYLRACLCQLDDDLLFKTGLVSRLHKSYPVFPKNVEPDGRVIRCITLGHLFRRDPETVTAPWFPITERGGRAQAGIFAERVFRCTEAITQHPRPDIGRD